MSKWIKKLLWFHSILGGFFSKKFWLIRIDYTFLLQIAIEFHLLYFIHISVLYIDIDHIGPINERNILLLVFFLLRITKTNMKANRQMTDRKKRKTERGTSGCVIKANTKRSGNAHEYKLHTWRFTVLSNRLYTQNRYACTTFKCNANSKWEKTEKRQPKMSIYQKRQTEMTMKRFGSGCECVSRCDGNNKNANATKSCVTMLNANLSCGLLCVAQFVRFHSTSVRSQWVFFLNENQCQFRMG